MALFDQFPYTNMHEINLDWIIGQIKTYTEKVDAMQISIDQLDQMMDDLKAFVIEQIEDLDIAQAVSDKLDEMLADGTLAGIVAAVYPVRTAHIERYGRVIDRYTTDEVERRLYAQSCTYANSKYYYVGNKDDADTTQRVSVWSDSGTYIDGRSYTELGHGNDIAYMNNKLYVATGYRVVVLDAESLDVIGTVERSVNLATVFAVAADAVNRKVYMIGTISGGIIGVDEYDESTGVVTNIITGIPSYGNVKQGACYDDGYLYVMYNNTNLIARISIADGALDMLYILPTNDGYFWTGEPETPFIRSGKLCFHAVMPYASSGYAKCVYSQLFVTDILGITAFTNIDDSPAMAPLSVTVNSQAAYDFNPKTTFCEVEEINALVPDIQIRLSNVYHGYIARPHASALTIQRASGSNLRIDTLMARQGIININFLTVGEALIEGANVILHNSTIESGSIRFSQINANNSTISGITSLERSELIIRHQNDLGCAGSPTLSNAYIDARIRRCNAMNTLYAQCAEFLNRATGRAFAMAFDIITADDVIHAVKNVGPAAFTADIEILMGSYRAVWNASGITLTKDGVNVAITNIFNITLIG